MKRIVIVEDKPWITSNAVLRLKEENANEVRIIYYPNTYGDASEKNELLDGLKETTNVEIDTVINQTEFVNKMEELYEKPDVVFLMDYDLEGDSTVPPEKRINYRYAKLKEYGEGRTVNSRKIWFYTISGVFNLEIITRNFPDNVLHVDKYTEGQLTWNVGEMNHILR